MGGSSSTQSTQIPDYMSDAGRTAAQRANMIYEAGRMPFTGIDVVAINPAEQAAIDQANMAATAFGMPSAAANPFEGMEVLESGGLRGYSSYPIYIADMQRLKDQRPEQYAALARQSGFDPITGEALAPAVPAAPAYHNTSYMERNTDRDDGDPLERHYSIFPNERPRTGPYADPNKPSGITYQGDYPTMQSMPSIRGYTRPDLGPVGNFVDDVKSAVRQSPAAKLFGALTGG